MTTPDEKPDPRLRSLVNYRSSGGGKWRWVTREDREAADVQPPQPLETPAAPPADIPPAPAPVVASSWRWQTGKPPEAPKQTPKELPKETPRAPVPAPARPTMKAPSVVKETAPPPPPPAPPKYGADEVAFVTSISNRTLEEIFNFSRREKISLLRDGPLGPVETMTRQGFDEVADRKQLREAFTIYASRGGTVAESDVFFEVKPNLSLQSKAARRWPS